MSYYNLFENVEYVIMFANLLHYNTILRHRYPRLWTVLTKCPYIQLTTN